MEDLLFASATEIARAIAAKDVSAVEVINAHLDRIAAVNPQLNAVVQVAAEQALVDAAQADAVLARGEVTGPLHGVPMTLKDSFDTAGVVSTWGTPGRKNFVPKSDATIAARLKDAGAILLGKTNTPEFTYYFETTNRIFGRTNNPYDLDRSSGGSSGGAAAIVASGGSAFDIGTDTGGSIRLPAHACGIAGIKPTTGRVPRSGHAVPPGGLVDWLTQVGPLARRVEDLALILPIIVGPDYVDPFVAPMLLGSPDAVPLNNLRGSFHVDNGICSPTPEIAAIVRKCVEDLGGIGMTFEEVRPPGIEETADLLSALLRGWDGGAWARKLLASAGTSEQETMLTGMLAAESAEPAAIVDLVDRWDRFRQRMLGFLAGYDVILSPVNAYAAIPHGTLGEHYPGFSYTMTYNLTGWPAVVVRAGTSPEGLPLGVQVIANPWREDVALAVAAQLEQAFGGYQKPPL